MNPMGNPQSPTGPRVVYHDNDEDEEKVVLVNNHQKQRCTSEQAECEPQRGSRSEKRVAWLSVCVVAAIISVTIVAAKACFLPSSSSTDAISKQEPIVPTQIQTLGWMGAIEDFRQELIELVVQKKEEERKEKIKSQLVDMSPVFALVGKAIDTFGVRAVFSDVFEHLEWYYPDSYYSKHYYCNKHGIGCDWQDPWWIWHYVGAASAEKLLREGSLLLDSVTGERLNDAVSVMNEIFRIQRLPYATKTSFHIEHGFIWHYLAETTPPDLHSYPKELAYDLCGQYESERYKVESATKYIGFECYHGIGHGVFMKVAMREMGGALGATTVFRPKGDFVLSDESFCEAHRICENAPNISTTPQNACKSGIKHSYWVFSSELSKSHDRDESEKGFEELYERACLNDRH